MDRWVLICTIVLALCGLWAEYESSQIGYISKEVRVLQDGAVQRQQLLEQPTSAKLLGATSIFLYTLAASVFISGMITARIDAANRQAHEEYLAEKREDVNRDVLESVFKTLVPEEIFTAVRDGIIRNPIVRKDATFYFDFSIEDDKVLLRQTFKYEMMNMGSEPYKNPIYVVHDDSAEEDYLERAKFSMNGQVVEEFDLAKGKYHEKLKANPLGPHETEGRIEIEIPPKSSMDVLLVFRMVFSSTSIQDAFFTEYPIVNMTLVVNHPEGFDFRIFQALSTEMKCSLDEPGRKIYEAFGGILPLQGFSFVMSPSESDSAPDLADA